MTTMQRIVVEKRGILLPLAVGVAATVLLYALVVYPLGRKVASNEAAERQARETLRLARQDYQSARALVSGKSQADVELQKFYKEVLPANESQAVRVTWLRVAQIARQSNVHHQRIASEPSKEKGSDLAKLTSNFSLSGNYQDVRRFIYALETAPEFLVLEHVQLAEADQQHERGLSMLLQVATYYRAGNGG
jgi:Tfp pilus assembly protein PilO